jgi:replicative DNA helicase
MRGEVGTDAEGQVDGLAADAVDRDVAPAGDGIVAGHVEDPGGADSDSSAWMRVAGKATLIIAKQRNGPVGDVPLTLLK